MESGLMLCLNSKEIVINLQRTLLSYTHCFPKIPIQAHQTEPAFALMLWQILTRQQAKLAELDPAQQAKGVTNSTIPKHQRGQSQDKKPKLVLF